MHEADSFYPVQSNIRVCKQSNEGTIGKWWMRSAAPWSPDPRSPSEVVMVAIGCRMVQDGAGAVRWAFFSLVRKAVRL